MKIIGELKRKEKRYCHWFLRHILEKEKLLSTTNVLKQSGSYVFSKYFNVCAKFVYFDGGSE